MKYSGSSDLIVGLPFVLFIEPPLGVNNHYINRDFIVIRSHICVSNWSEEFDRTPIVGFESESVFVLLMVEFLISGN